jgi:hypothetical protein
MFQRLGLIVAQIRSYYVIFYYALMPNAATFIYISFVLNNRKVFYIYEKNFLSLQFIGFKSACIAY